MSGRSALEFGGNLVAALLRCVRYAIFFVLLTLRPLVLFVARVGGPIALLCGLAYGFLSGWSSTPCLVLLGTSLAIAVVTFAYDFVLARIGPDGLDLYS